LSITGLASSRTIKRPALQFSLTFTCILFLTRILCEHVCLPCSSHRRCRQLLLLREGHRVLKRPALYFTVILCEHVCLPCSSHRRCRQLLLLLREGHRVLKRPALYFTGILCEQCVSSLFLTQALQAAAAAEGGAQGSQEASAVLYRHFV